MTGISTSLTIKDRFTNTLNRGAASVDRMLKSMRAAPAAMQDFNKKQMDVAQGAEKIKSAWSGIGGLIRTALAAFGAKQVIGLSDSLTSTTARLDLMNDGSQSTDELSAKIMASAQRSRAAYLDTADAVAKLGINASAAFKSNDETIAFMEQVNKLFVIGGANAVEQSNAMTQLTQAMAAGALRGEELNSILDAGPGIARAIEKYMGVAEGQIKKVAEQGLVTADVVKNALFAAAEDTNAKFESMPKTWAQVWTQIKNRALGAFDEVLTKVNDFINSDVGTAMVDGILRGINLAAAGINWLLDTITNVYDAIAAKWTEIWAVMQPILQVAIPAAIVGIITYMIMWGIAAVQAAIATITAMSPIILIGLAIGAVIGLIIAIAMEMGATFGDVCGFIGGVLGGLFALLHNLVADAWNFIASFGEFIGNFLNNPVAAVLHLFYDMVDGCLGLLETLANALDGIFGSNMSDAIGGWRQGLKEWVDKGVGEKKFQYERIDKLDYGQTIDSWTKGGKAFGDGISNGLGTLFGGTGGLTGGLTDSLATAMNGIDINSVGEVGKINTDVNIADEDIKLMKDVAEMRYVQNFVTLDPTISMSATVTKDADFDAFYDQFSDRVAAEFEATAEDYYS